MYKILITGGTGYIGSYLVEYFKRNKYQVITTSRKKQNTSDVYRKMDLSEPSTIKDICKDIDIVIHTATMDERQIKTNEGQALQINGVATRNLYLDAVANNVKKFIYLSTFHVYGKSYGTIDETVLPMPISDYGLTHYVGELYLHSLSTINKTECASVRITNGIGIPKNGADKWYLVINDFCKSAYTDQKIIMKSNGLPLRDFVSIQDIVTAIDALLQSNEWQTGLNIFNISSENAISIREVLNQVVEIYEKRYMKNVELLVPSYTKEDLSKVKPLFVSSQKIRQLKWFPQQKITDTIHEIFDYLEKES